MGHQRYCVWMITGGTTHALCCLSACIKYAIRSDRIIIPYSETHNNFGESFYSLFTVDQKSQLARYFIKEDEYDKAIEQYTPPFTGMPSLLSDSIISGPEPDMNGDQRYFLKGIRAIGKNERYLDYPENIDENKSYILTWGKHNKYWKNQLLSVLDTLRPSQSMLKKILVHKETFYNSNQGQQYIGAHFRNTDYISNLENLLRTTLEASRKTGIKNIFWATDDQTSKAKAHHFFQEKGLNLITIGNIPEHKNLKAINLHSISQEQLKLIGSSKLDQQSIFISEALILSNSYMFIRSKGTVPFLVESLRRSQYWRDLIISGH